MMNIAGHMLVTSHKKRFSLLGSPPIPHKEVVTLISAMLVIDTGRDSRNMQNILVFADIQARTSAMCFC
jgi:hypothetical protein